MSGKLALTTEEEINEVSIGIYSWKKIIKKIKALIIKKQNDSYKKGFEIGGESALKMMAVNEGWDEKWLDYYIDEWQKEYEKT